MMRKIFKGMGVALVTPFKENGEVDYEALETLVQMHIESDTDFLCVQGTTVEGKIFTPVRPGTLYM